jgi:DNA-binding response OmpR family regulator
MTDMEKRMINGETAARTRILAIDDDFEMTELFKVTLEPDLFEVITTNSGPQGVEIARKSAFDVVIVDLSMPVMDGFEVCREVRKFSNVPILILSAINKPEVIVQALDDGADDYLIKPINRNVLIAHINKAVRRARNDCRAIQALQVYPL